jgi:hypothetical protein
MQTKWVKEMQTSLGGWTPSPSTVGAIHRRSGSILLWARV